MEVWTATVIDCAAWTCIIWLASLLRPSRQPHPRFWRYRSAKIFHFCPEITPIPLMGGAASMLTLPKRAFNITVLETLRDLVMSSELMAGFPGQKYIIFNSYLMLTTQLCGAAEARRAHNPEGEQIPGYL
jgi:hypothetical protein